jgi:hypothetical protein
MNAKLLFTAATGLLLLFTATVHAQTAVYGEGEKRNGMDLVNDCNNGDGDVRIVCTEYIKGVSDGFTIATVVFKHKNPVCIPNGVSADQLVKVVLKYAYNHPAELQQPSSSIVVVAIRKAFPCAE